jgi:hypothetical protein
MKRSYFAVLGLGLLAAVVAMAIAFGTEGLDGGTLVAMAVLLLAADLLVLGGLVEEIPVDSVVVRWFHLLGAGIVLLGLANVVFGAGRVAGAEGLTVGAAAVAVGGLALVFVGADFLRGGVHYDLSRLE